MEAASRPVYRKFLVRDERLLGPLLDGDVAEDENDTGDRAILVADGSAAVIDVDFRAVSANQNGVASQADDGIKPLHLRDRVFDGFPGDVVKNVEDGRQRSAKGQVDSPTVRVDATWFIMRTFPAASQVITPSPMRLTWCGAAVRRGKAPHS